MSGVERTLAEGSEVEGGNPRWRQHCTRHSGQPAARIRAARALPVCRVGSSAASKARHRVGSGFGPGGGERFQVEVRMRPGCRGGSGRRARAAEVTLTRKPGSGCSFCSLRGGQQPGYRA